MAHGKKARPWEALLDPKGYSQMRGQLCISDLPKIPIIRSGDRRVVFTLSTWSVLSSDISHFQWFNFKKLMSHSGRDAWRSLRKMREEKILLINHVKAVSSVRVTPGAAVADGVRVRRGGIRRCPRRCQRTERLGAGGHWPQRKTFVLYHEPSPKPLLSVDQTCFSRTCSRGISLRGGCPLNLATSLSVHCYLLPTFYKDTPERLLFSCLRRP